MAAKKSFDYSKWDKIELSDDESDLHPNIDKESWFRMKHRSRLEREEREDEEIKQYESLNKENNARLQVINARYDFHYPLFYSLTDSLYS
jgi:cell division cycle protein 37